MEEQRELPGAWIVNLPEGGWLACCSEDCANDWLLAYKKPGVRGASFVQKQLPPKRFACVVCAYCGTCFGTVRNCVLHSPGYCPGYVFTQSAAARWFVIYWDEASGGADLTPELWDRAEQIALRHGGTLTGVEIAEMMLG